MTTERWFFWWWTRETCSTMHHMYHTYICDCFRHLKSTRFWLFAISCQLLEWKLLWFLLFFFFFQSHLIQDVIIWILNNHHNIDIVCLILSSWDFPNHVELHVELMVSLESSWWVRGALIWFKTIWSFNVQVVDYWIIFSMKIKYFTFLSDL
jgi:hypothetical protein